MTWVPWGVNAYVGEKKRWEVMEGCEMGRGEGMGSTGEDIGSVM